MTTKKKKKKARRRVALVLVSLLSLIFFCTGGGLLYVNNLLNKLDRTKPSGTGSLPSGIFDQSTDDELRRQLDDAQNMNMLQEKGIENILLIGSDSRGSDTGRSDAMMILSINHDTHKIHMVSLMRAMYVCIPTNQGNAWFLLNSAYSWGGTDLLINTIQTNFRVHIDHYVTVDFNSFTQIIDLIGGVEITLTQGECNVMASEYFTLAEPGTHLLTGAQALAYSRVRYTDNDFVRTSRQRTVMTKVIEKAKTMNVLQLANLANQIFPLVGTDMSNSEILSYVANMGTLLNYPVSQMMLPVENQDGEHYVGIMTLADGSEAYQVDFKNNITELQRFLKE